MMEYLCSFASLLLHNKNSELGLYLPWLIIHTTKTLTLQHLSVSYIVVVVSTICYTFQCEPLSPLLSLLKHARSSVRCKVELLNHHVFGNADLLSQVQTFWTTRQTNETQNWKQINPYLHVSAVNACKSQTNKDPWQIIMYPLVFLFLSALNSWRGLI